MGIADRRRQKLAEAVTPVLTPGEQVQAGLPFGQTGPTPYFFLITYLIILFIRYYAVVVTDRRVLLLKRGKVTNRIKGVVSEYGCGDVSVAEWSPGSLWSVLMLATPGGEMKLNVPRLHNGDTEQLVAALGAAWAPPPAG